MPAEARDRLLLAVDDVARLLSCSRRNIYRLSDSGALPRPVKLGRLTRWRREDIERWVAALAGEGTR